MAADGYLNFNTKIDTKGFSGGLNTIDKSLERVKGTLKSFAGALGLAFSTAALVAFGKKSLETAASINAANSQLEQTFGSFKDSAVSAIKRVADESGILETRMQSTGTSIYAFARTSGMESTQALGMMEDALQVAADSAAYYDRSLEDTGETLKSFLKGNYANDAALGLSATEYTRNAKAMELYGKKYIDLSEAQKQLTLLQMVKDANKLSGAMGQADRESEGWENVVGNLKESWRQLFSVMGQPVLKLAVPIVKRLTGALQNLTTAANTAWTALSKVMGWEQQTQAITAAADAQNQLTSAVEDTAKAQDGALAGFDEIQTLTAETAMNEETAALPSSGGSASEIITVNPQSTENIDNMVTAFESMKTVLEPVIISTQNLGTALEPLKTFAAQGLSDFYTGFLQPLGVWAIGEGFPRFVDAITNGLAMVDWESINTSLNNLWNSVLPFAENIGEGLLWMWENVLVPLGMWTIGEGFPRFVDLVSNTLQQVDWGTLKTSLENVWKSVIPFAENVGEGLFWFYENVISPLVLWTTNNLIPVMLDLITEAIRLLDEIITAAEPSLQWIWDNFFVPIRDFTWQIIIDFLNFLTSAFKGLSDWAKENHEQMQTIADIILGFLAGLWVYNTAKDMIKFLKGLKDAFGLLTKSLSVTDGLACTAGLALIAIGILFAGIFAIASVWKDMNDFQKVITILGALAAAAVAAAIAIAVFHASWSVGIAAAAIAAGIALIVASFAVIESKTKKATTNISSSGSTHGGGGGSFGLSSISTSSYAVPKLATGAVIPPNREFLAVLGDQKHGTNIEAPLETLVQAFKRAQTESGGSSNSTVILEVDGREFGRAVVNLGGKEERRIGLRLVKT